MEHTQKVGDPGVGTLPPGGAIPEFSRRGVKSGKDFGAQAGAIFGLERASWGNWADGECSHSAKERDAGVLSLICESWDSEKRSLTGSPTVTLPFTVTPLFQRNIGNPDRTCQHRRSLEANFLQGHYFTLLTGWG